MHLHSGCKSHCLSQTAKLRVKSSWPARFAATRNGEDLPQRRRERRALLSGSGNGLVDYRPIFGFRNRLAFRLSRFQPDLFGELGLRKRFFGRLPEGGAMLKIGDIRNVSSVSIAIKDVD